MTKDSSGDATASGARVRTIRVLRAIGFLALVVVLFVHCRTRPANLPLETKIDGPDPAQASTVIVFLHGRGAGLGEAQETATRLRRAGLRPDIAIVLLEGPFPFLFGRAWGSNPEDQASSRARVRARMRELLGDRPDAGAQRIIVAGFSQGAGMAIDLAVEEPRITALASFSPCFSFLRGELPKRDDLHILLAHGTKDSRCPVEESRSLHRVLQNAHKDVKYIEFEGPHEVPAEVLRALAVLAAAP